MICLVFILFLCAYFEWLDLLALVAKYDVESESLRDPVAIFNKIMCISVYDVDFKYVN